MSGAIGGPGPVRAADRAGGDDSPSLFWFECVVLAVCIAAALAALALLTHRG